MDNLFLGQIVESTIQADLERFKDYTMNLPKFTNPALKVRGLIQPIESLRK
jgi:uncharacterized membrane protein